MAGPTIKFAGRMNDEEMMQYYVHAKAFLFPGEEDFGITPVEAQSAGCPVLAYGRGGAGDSAGRQDGPVLCAADCGKYGAMHLRV